MLIGKCDGGCFSAETQVRLADDTVRRADGIREGDLLFNPVEDGFRRVRSVVASPSRRALWQITTALGILRVTDDHVFQTASGVRTARELVVGVPLITEAGSDTPVLAASPIANTEGEMVWNYEMEGSGRAAHFVASGGLATGDFTLQLALKQRRSDQESRRRLEREAKTP